MSNPSDPIRITFIWQTHISRLMNAFVHVHVVQKTSDMLPGISQVAILMQGHFLDFMLFAVKQEVDASIYA
jgi:hypothetical protein